MENNPNAIEVSFTHPRSAELFTAEISPQCTGQKAIAGLMIGGDEGPFLEQPPAGRSYRLVIKSTLGEISPNMTFAEAGVSNGDVVEVQLTAAGA